MGTRGPPPRITPSETLTVFAETTEPCAPFSASEVAQSLECDRDTVVRPLEQLTERGALRARTVTDGVRVWWRPSAEELSASIDAESTRFGSFVESVTDYGIIALDPDGSIERMNDGATSITGFEATDVVGQHVSVFYSDEDVDRGVPTKTLAEATAICRAEDEGWRVRRNGSTFRANVVINAVRDDEDRLRGFVMVIRDLTHHIVGDALLHRERDLLDRILEASPVGITAMSPDGTIVEINERGAEILGIDRADEDEKLYDRSAWNVFDERGRPIPIDDRVFGRVIDTESPVTDVASHVERPDGSRVWLSVSGVPVFDVDEELSLVVLVYEDVTAFRDQSAQLERQRDLIEQILETSPVGITVHDTDGTVTRFNNRTREILDLDRNDVESYSTADRPIYEEDGTVVPIEEHPFALVLSSGEPVYDRIYRVAVDGADRWLSINASPIYGDDGAIDQVITTHEDVTELKTHERELETELSEILGRISDAVFALDDDWRFTLLNDQAAAVLRRAEDELLGKRVWEEFPEADAEFETECRRAMATQESVNFEVYSAEIDRWLEFNVYPSPTGLSIYFRDITRRKRIESELRDSEEKFRQITEHLEQATWMTTGDMSEVLYVAPSYETIFGRSADDLQMDHYDIIEAIHPDDCGIALEFLDVDMVTEETDIEYRVVHPDGSIRWVHDRWAPVHDENGEIYRVIGVAEDITERKRREQALEESERRYRTLVDHFPDGSVAMFDRSLQYTVAGGELLDILDIDPDEIVGTSIFERYSPDVVATIEPYYRDAIEGEGNSFELEYYGRQFLAQTLPVENADGEIFAGMVVVLDVTERKKRERELIRYKQIVETVTDGVYAIDTEGRYTLVNDAYAEMVGYSREQLLGSPATMVVDSETARTAQEFGRELITGERDSARIEADVHTADGRTIKAEATFAMVASDNQGYERVGVVRDVTERVEREAALEQYKTVFDTVTDGIYVLDAEFNFTDVNDAYAEMTGYDRSRLIGSHCSLVIDRDVSEEAAEMARKVGSGRKSSVTLEAEMITADGDHIPGESNFTALPAPDGSFRGSVGVVRDLTERKRYEEEIETRARQQRAVADLGTSALECPNLDRLFEEAVDVTIETLDTDCCEVLELDEATDELRLRHGQGWRPGIVGNTTVAANENSQAGFTLLSEQPVVVDDLDTETRFVPPTLLTSHDMKSGICVIIGSASEPWGILGTHVDHRRRFTDEDIDFLQSIATILGSAMERQRFETQLTETVEKLETSNERLERFAYISSHDLLEPLRMITNYLQLLESRYRDELDDDARDFIDFAVDGATRMHEMITDLLSYSRIDNEAVPFTPTDCNGVVDDVVDSLSLQIEESDAEMIVDDLPTVDADPNQLQQLFQNLVSNAIKYRSDEPPRVEITAEGRSDDWLIQVDDNGIGIDPDRTDQIFEVFNRLHTRDEYPGTGIGLALCAKIVERHGGRIWVESSKHEGSSFKFTIPRHGGERT